MSLIIGSKYFSNYFPLCHVYAGLEKKKEKEKEKEKEKKKERKKKKKTERKKTKTNPYSLFNITLSKYISTIYQLLWQRHITFSQCITITFLIEMIKKSNKTLKPMKCKILQKLNAFNIHLWTSVSSISLDIVPSIPIFLSRWLFCELRRKKRLTLWDLVRCYIAVYGDGNKSFGLWEWLG